MIAIKDMEMPKSCSKCPFSATFPNIGLKNGVCNDLHLPFNRHPYCPLVEIVTCKDCEHCRFESVEGMPYYWCDKDDRVTSEDYYCADGERRE